MQWCNMSVLHNDWWTQSVGVCTEALHPERCYGLFLGLFCEGKVLFLHHMNTQWLLPTVDLNGIQQFSEIYVYVLTCGCHHENLLGIGSEWNAEGKLYVWACACSHWYGRWLVDPCGGEGGGWNEGWLV